MSEQFYFLSPIFPSVSQVVVAVGGNGRCICGGRGGVGDVSL